MSGIRQTMERIIPDEIGEDDGFHQEDLKLHLERYGFAASKLRPGRVLDIACGTGYGVAFILRSVPDGITEILGVDLSREGIEYARRRYGDPRAQFICSDAMEFSDPDGFDTIISLETIEHLPDPESFAGRIAGMLRPDGALIASIPTTPSKDLNIYHRHDFTERSFRRLFECRGLVEVDRLAQIQPVRLGNLLARRWLGKSDGKPNRLDDLRKNLPLYYLKHPGSFLRRILSLASDGFNNRYLTIAWKKTGDPRERSR